MPFRGRPIEAQVISIEQRNAASLERISDLETDLLQANDPHLRYAIMDQIRDVQDSYIVRNNPVERQSVGSRLGQAVVGWVKNIPGRIVHPG